MTTNQRKHADYSYAAMSNLVTKADRRSLPKNTTSDTGEPTSLAGLVNVKDMGNRAFGSYGTEDTNKGNLTTKKHDASKTRSRQHQQQRDAAAYDGTVYRPTTTETKTIFQNILSIISDVIGDQSPDVTNSAADFIIEVLKSDARELEKKGSIESALGQTIDESQFLKLVQLGSKITDYGNPDSLSRNADTIDEDIALIIDEEDGASLSESDSEISQYSDERDEVGNAELSFSMHDTAANTDSDNLSLNCGDIDASWLQRRIGHDHPSLDDSKLQQYVKAVLELLEAPISTGILENDLMELFDYERENLVQILVRNREKIYWCTKLSRTDAQQVPALLAEIRAKGFAAIADELESPDKEYATSTAAAKPVAQGTQPALLDLSNMIFAEGNHLMSNKKVDLPEGSYKRSHASYEEVFVPALKSSKHTNSRTVSITSMPSWTHEAFANTTTLNHIQSAIYDSAFLTDHNILLCAPTGAGKTNVAMLSILHEMSKYRAQSGILSLEDFKIIYIAPLKALVSEMVGNFSARLESYGMTVQELTGDSQLTKQQIASTQIIVTTPEKWDVITRKADETSYTNLVRLIIIDEIHLLHDSRGPVLESIISRVHRNFDGGSAKTRLIGLSATLPNYKDVAEFLRVPIDEGLFYFDQSYRPCPLQQEYVGITERKPIKRLQAMNLVCYEKMLATLNKNNQVLIFVHSRKETYKTARYIRDHALEKDDVQRLTRGDAASREILSREAQHVQDSALRELLPYGLAMHHAGMSKVDRTTAEDLFAEGLIQVLVSTATLAWGVNLPAHTVIIKGTQIYSPEKGAWTELSPQDVLQMLGRAGRPQYDTFGEGVIITNQSELQYYLSLLNQQLPIESQLISKLCDNLNAEIVLGNVTSREEAVQWLKGTYLYIRMLKDPILYQVGACDVTDTTLYQKRIDLIHSAATVLARCGMVNYNITSGKLQATEIGKVASHYYVTHESIRTYNQYLKPGIGMIEFLRVFSMSEEFKYIPVREDEKMEVQKLLDRVPVPIRDSPDDCACKINVLLQAHISKLKLEGFALLADMVYVTQSAGRIMRALFEICLRRGWSQSARIALQLCQMVEQGLWSTRNPLAQFVDVPLDLLRKLERKDFPWSRYFDLNPQELGELCGEPKSGHIVHQLIQYFPRLNINAHIQPITRSLMRIELTIMSNFTWNDKYHGSSQVFWILIDDANGDKLMHSERFLLRKQYLNNEHTVDFTLSIEEPISPHYYCTIISDRWLHSSSKVAIPMRSLQLPGPFPAPSPILDLQHITSKEVNKIAGVDIYDFDGLNAVQTQVYPTFAESSDSALLTAPSGTGKYICVELAILQHITHPKATKIAILCSSNTVIVRRLKQIHSRFAMFNLNMASLGEDMTSNNKIMLSSDIIFATYEQFEIFSRRWRQRKGLHNIGLLVVDQIHLIGGQIGADLEIAVSRARFIAEQTECPMRMIAIGESLADPRDVADWLGVQADACFNFNKMCGKKIQTHLQSFEQTHYPSLLYAAKQATKQIMATLPSGQSVIIFVDSRRCCLEVATDLLSVLQLSKPNSDPSGSHVAASTDLLVDLLQNGIGCLHEAMDAAQRTSMLDANKRGQLSVMVATHAVRREAFREADLVIILETQTYDSTQHKYVHYPVSDILEMLDAGQSVSKAILMISASKRSYFKKFLEEGLPVESQYLSKIHDNVVAEISADTIETKQEAVDWLTWTFFYRRLNTNPAYYGLSEARHEAVSAYLSDLIENTLLDLTEGNLIEVAADEMQLSAQNLGLIAFHYAINYITAQTFALSLTERTKMKGLLEIVTSASEFDTLPIRRHEEIVLKKIYDRVPVKLAIDFEDPHHKAFILVQAHFSRIQLPIDLQQDQIVVLNHLPKLLSACVDILSSEGHLNAVNAMELSQMTIQAVWERDSALRQIPFFTDEVIARCAAIGVEDVIQIAELEDETRTATLQMTKAQLNQVAAFCNQYPDYEMTYSLDNETLVAGETCSLQVQLSRDSTDDVDITVKAPYYPQSKIEHWWLILADANTILAIKKITLRKDIVVALDFILPQAGKQNLSLSCISDSYIGVDQEQTIEVDVLEDDKMELDS